MFNINKVIFSEFDLGMTIEEIIKTIFESLFIKINSI